jgi:hypothetical protein
MVRRVALVRTDVSEELSASVIRVTRIGEIGKLAVTSNRRTVVPSSPILVTLMMEALSSPETSALTRANGVTSQKTPFFKTTEAYHFARGDSVVSTFHCLCHATSFTSASSAGAVPDSVVWRLKEQS